MENIKINQMIKARELKMHYYNEYNSPNIKAKDDSIFYFHESKSINYFLHAYATFDVFDHFLILYLYEIMKKIKSIY